MNVTFIPNIKESVSIQEDIQDIFTMIRTDELLKNRTLNIRSQMNNKEQYLAIKRTLPQFLPSLCVGTDNDSHTIGSDFIPSGIVQFDIDLSKNPDFDSHSIKTRLLELNCFYYHDSPGLGLKFGMMTDFTRLPDDTLTSCKQRFRQAYAWCKSEFLKVCPEVVLDDCTQSLVCGDFICHDPEAYLNLNGKIHILNDQCFSSENPKHPITSSNHVTIEIIRVVLGWIPRDLAYSERLKCNSSIFNSLTSTSEAIDLLFNHWTTDSREKLRSDLEYQSNHRTVHNFGWLVNQARRFGMPHSVTGRARKSLKPLNQTEMLDELHSIDDARTMIRSELEHFWKNKEDTLFNISVGLGKTQLVLEMLRTIDPSKRVLYVCSNHDLIEEIVTRFNEIKVKQSRIGQSISLCDYFKGKNAMCERKEIVEKYTDARIPIPYIQCLKDCHLVNSCKYINQFSTIANVIFMTHDELFNKQALVNNRRTNDEGKEKTIIHRFDAVIVDEDCLKLANNTEEDLKTPYTSLRKIILSCMDGQSLIESIRLFRDSVLVDAIEMKSRLRQQRVVFRTTEQFIRDTKAFSKNTIENDILIAFNSFLISGDEHFLKGIRFDFNQQSRERTRFAHSDAKLIRSSIRFFDERFNNTPKLFLDATSDENVIKHLMPHIKMIDLKAKKTPANRIFQCQNFNLTKNWLLDEKNRNSLVKGLQRLINEKGYKNVGLITYKNIGFEIKDFDKSLAEQLNIKNYNHFGNIRGSDQFKEVDCLLILGRHNINQNDLEDWSMACFGEFNKTDREVVEVPVRMNNNVCALIENHMYQDVRTQSLYQHLCLSETIQAVGRIRWFNNTPGDVWYFSTESLGLSVEIDGWFKYEDWFNNVEKLKGVPNLALKGKPRSENVKESISLALKDREWSKKKDLIASLNLDSFKDKPSTLIDLGFSKTFSIDKQLRMNLFEECGYRLDNGIWLR